MYTQYKDVNQPLDLEIKLFNESNYQNPGRLSIFPLLTSTIILINHAASLTPMTFNQCLNQMKVNSQNTDMK